MKDKETIEQIGSDELEQLIEAVRTKDLTKDEIEMVAAVLSTFNDICLTLKERNSSMARLRKLLGIKTEKKPTPSTEGAANKSNRKKRPSKDSESETKEAGIEAGDLGGGPSKEVNHKVEGISKGDPCPACKCGRVYHEASRQQSFTVIVGQPILSKERHNREVLRCNRCNQEFKANLPKGIDPKKSYTPSAAATVAYLRYIMGLPHHRLAISGSLSGDRLLSESTMFAMCESLADKLMRIYGKLEKEAADADLMHIDDTRMKIREHVGKPGKNRRTTRTSGMVTEVKRHIAEEPGQLSGDLMIGPPEIHHVCLFQTGSQVAGEFLDDILQQRSRGTPAILMADALSANNPVTHKDRCLRSSCLVHARRNFWDIQDCWPDQVLPILELMATVFGVEKRCREEGITGEQRRMLHQGESRLALTDIWLRCFHGLRDKPVEPNSSLGKAMKYILNHFNALCMFLKVADCPIENNLVERLLKKMILHRKNSLFYQTDIGAGVGDVIMSVGFTAKQAGVNPHSYFEDVMLNFDEAESVEDWLPWNWKKIRAEAFRQEKVA